MERTSHKREDHFLYDELTTIDTNSVWVWEVHLPTRQFKTFNVSVSVHILPDIERHETIRVKMYYRHVIHKYPLKVTVFTWNGGFDIKYLENCILKLFKVEVLFEMSFIFKVIVKEFLAEINHHLSILKVRHLQTTLWETLLRFRSFFDFPRNLATYFCKHFNQYISNKMLNIMR